MVSWLVLMPAYAEAQAPATGTTATPSITVFSPDGGGARPHRVSLADWDRDLLSWSDAPIVSAAQIMAPRILLTEDLLDDRLLGAVLFVNARGCIHPERGSGELGRARCGEAVGARRASPAELRRMREARLRRWPTWLFPRESSPDGPRSGALRSKAAFRHALRRSGMRTPAHVHTQATPCPPTSSHEEEPLCNDKLG